MNLEELKKPDGKTVLLNAEQRKTLIEAGIPNVEMLAMSRTVDVAELEGFSEEGAARAVKAAISAVMPEMFMAADKYHREVRCKVERLTTGSKALDSLLGGGIETESLTEVAGENGVGKTQLCLMLSLTVQKPKAEGGLGGGCLFFDTENTFRSDRILSMSDNPEALKGITVAPCFSSDHQALLLDNAPLYKLIEDSNVRLIIVDSLIAHFRSEYIGREELATRQQLLNHYLHGLFKLARAYKLAVVYTSQAISNPEPFGVQVKAVGGNIVGHASTTRLWIRRGKGGVRIAKLAKSPWREEGEVVFRISQKGIEDVEEKKD